MTPNSLLFICMTFLTKCQMYLWGLQHWTGVGVQKRIGFSRFPVIMRMDMANFTEVWGVSML